MMLAGPSFTDKLLPHADGKRHVEQPVSVNVSEFSPADPEFAPAKTVRPGFDARPTEHRCLDLLRSSRQCPVPAANFRFASSGLL